MTFTSTSLHSLHHQYSTPTPLILPNSSFRPLSITPILQHLNQHEDRPAEPRRRFKTPSIRCLACRASPRAHKRYPSRHRIAPSGSMPRRRRRSIRRLPVRIFPASHTNIQPLIPSQEPTSNPFPRSSHPTQTQQHPLPPCSACPNPSANASTPTPSPTPNQSPSAATTPSCTGSTAPRRSASAA